MLPEPFDLGNGSDVRVEGWFSLCSIESANDMPTRCSSSPTIGVKRTDFPNVQSDHPHSNPTILRRTPTRPFHIIAIQGNVE